MNYNHASAVTGRKARHPFGGMLLMVFGLLLSFSQRILASGDHPGTGVYTYTVNATKDYSIAGSGHPDVITVNVSPTPPVPGEALTFIISGSSYTPVISTDASGNAILSFTSNIVGTVAVQIYDGTTLVGTIDMHFLAAPGPPDPIVSHIAVIQNPATADGVSQDIVKAFLLDQYGNPVSNGTVVNFSIQTGTAVMTVSGTSVNGIVSAVFTSTVAGNVRVQAQVLVGATWTYLTDTNNPVNNYVDIQFLAGPVDPSKSYITVTQNPAIADGTSQDVVTAYLFDANGNPITDGTTVTFSTLSGTATNVNGTTQSVTTGSAPSDYVSTVAGSVQVQATVNGVLLHDQNNPGNNYVSIQFVAGAVDPAKSYISVTQNPATADGVTQDIVTAYLFDVNGNPVTNGTNVTFSILSGTATNVNGTTQSVTTGSAPAQYVSTVTGSVQVQASVGGVFLNDQANPANNFVTIQFVAGAVDPAKSYITVTKSPSPADGTSQDIVTAYLFDAFGNPVTNGTNVTFSIQSGTATIVNTATQSVTTGSAPADYVSTVAGNVQVQAIVNGVYLTDQANPANNYVTVQFVAGPVDPAKSYITVTKNPATADGTTQDIVTAYLFDANGNPITDGTNVTFSIKSGTATNVNGVTQSVTTGSAPADYVSTLVGSVQVQASVNGVYLNDQANPGNNYVTIQFVAGLPVPGNPGGGGGGGSGSGGSGGNPPGGGGTPPNGGGNGGNNTGPGDNSGYTILFVEQDDRLADGKQQDSVIAYITDANKNPVPGVAVTFFIQTSPTAGTITSGVQFNSSPVNVTTDASGMARIALTSTTPGTAFVDATIVDPTSGNTVLIDGSYEIVHFLNIPDTANPETTLSVVVYEALADGIQQTEVKAHIVDLSGQVMPGQAVTFSIDSGSGTIVTPQPVVTDANGDAYIYITSKTVGYVTITATVDNMQITNGSPARVQFAAINIYVPKVFTPNGDGTNDLLKPILVGISTFHYFSVYNRWGNLIFTTQDPNQGWDGTFRGVPQPVETYLWIGEGIDTNGRKIVQKGMVSLVR